MLLLLYLAQKSSESKKASKNNLFQWLSLFAFLPVIVGTFLNSTNAFERLSGLPIESVEGMFLFLLLFVFFLFAASLIFASAFQRTPKLLIPVWIAAWSVGAWLTLRRI